MLKMIFALLILPMFAAAQDKGIDFEYNTNWEQVLKLRLRLKTNTYLWIVLQHGVGLANGCQKMYLYNKR